jgi:pimeloyl-ACP methyl ester carboxylesterase
MTSLTQEGQVREESIWFSTADRPLFGKLTSPHGGMARGAVVLSPPIGRESRQARRALRSLAFYLAMDGYVTLRYDHFGTGDSSGLLESDEFDHAWLEGVDQAVTFLRSLGPESISAVGMRMGATIVGTAAASYDLGLSSFVMWDPCETGRSYVRELNALGALRETMITDDTGDLAKMVEYPLSQEAASRLTGFSLLEQSSRPLAERVLVVVRDDRPVTSKFRARWNSSEVEWIDTPEQGPMLEALLTTMVQPTATVENIRTWIALIDSSSAPIAGAPKANSAVVMKGSNTFPVRESVVELGPNNLFGIVSEPVDGANGPLMVMVNGVNEDHVGPARLWVELSRQWAGLGLRCVRFDPLELGESPWLPSKGERPILDELRPQDVRDTVRALNPATPSETVLIGYCNGAELALEVALELETSGVCAINPRLGTGVYLHVERLETSDRESVRTLMQRLEKLRNYAWMDKIVGAISRRVLASKFGRKAVFGALKLSSVCPPKVRQALRENHTETLLVLSPEDLSAFRHIPIIGSMLRRRQASSESFRVEIIPELDHAFLSVYGRDRAVEILHQHVTEIFLSRTSPLKSEGGERSS